MRVISRKALVEAGKRHPEVAKPLDVWYRIAKRAEWKSLAEVRRTWPSADPVDGLTVFNIKGNSFRLITEINYSTKRVFIRRVLTHAEYDKGGWKNERNRR